MKMFSLLVIRFHLRRKAFAVIGIIAAAFSQSLEVAHANDAPFSLAGSWRFEMDRNDAGKKEAWFNRELPGSIRLPGSMAENNLGNPITKIRQQIWGGRWTTDPVWHPMIKTDYRGAAWYQKTVTIPAAWQGKVVELFLERVCWQSELWVDGSYAGKGDSLSALISTTSGCSRRACIG